MGVLLKQLAILLNFKSLVVALEVLVRTDVSGPGVPGGDSPPRTLFTNQQLFAGISVFTNR